MKSLHVYQKDSGSLVARPQEGGSTLDTSCPLCA